MGEGIHPVVEEDHVLGGTHTSWSSIYNANIVGKLQYNNNFDLEVIVISIILNTYCIN